ncbi:hypothetical protein ACWCPI_35040 [Streptomyces sp. NPDC001920]
MDFWDMTLSFQESGATEATLPAAPAETQVAGTAVAVVNEEEATPDGEALRRSHFAGCGVNAWWKQSFTPLVRRGISPI